MSTTHADERRTKKTKQQTLDGSTDNRAHSIQEGTKKGHSAILWRVGRDTEIDDTESQLQEAYRRCVEQGLFDEGDE